MAVAGCQQPQAGPGVSLAEERVSITELAAQLGLGVSERAPTHVTLKKPGNTVMLFTFEGGKAYVNAKPIGPMGRVEKVAGKTYVPADLVQQIRSAMRTTGRFSRRKSLSSCVVIDAGHGGKDPGAISSLGYYEKVVNLEVARKVGYLLRNKGLKVVMTRESDRFIELEERAAVANRHGADLFVSIHSDSSSNSSARGFTIYVARSASWSSRRAAAAIGRAMLRAGLTSRGTERADYRVLVQTRCPAVLIELGYLSNRDEARLLRSSSFQDRLARAIAEGISEFLG